MERRDGRHWPPPSPRQPGAPTLLVTGLLACPESGTALAEVDLNVVEGRVHGLAGERAATSALVGLLAGDAVAHAGRIEIDGRPLTFDTPEHAHEAGVWTVREPIGPSTGSSISERIAAEPEDRRTVDHARPPRDVGAFLRGLGLGHLEADGELGRLSVAQQRLVEIARAAYHGARVIVLDQLEGGWATREAEPLHEVLGRLVARSVAVLYVTRQRQEIYDLCDSFTVLAAADGTASVVELGRSTSGRGAVVSWQAPVLLRSGSV